ncbi:c-type cytochrome [Ideonella livida]|uniref:C-type cytochrome n=1 Tax=Ideonella livida TaxID=2707176 RepID=A0A7C9TLZ0_9BURK|nr:c-type cytochrome [Ideonella livida]NDY92824.1 c-type cytochrome [Ideonella livida]
MRAAARRHPPARGAGRGRWLSPALGLAFLVAAGGLRAQDLDALGTRALAAQCAQCHGTEGQAVPGTSLPALAGRPAHELLAQLMAFRDGRRPATVMHQLTRGYTPEQLQRIAHYLATRPPAP